MKRRGVCNLSDYQQMETSHKEIRFDYSYEEIKALYNKNDRNERESFDSFLVNVFSFCGIRIVGENALKYVKKTDGFLQESRFDRITGIIKDRRFTARIVPDSWQGSFRTKFELHGTDIICDGVLVAQIDAFYVGNTINNIFYLAKNTDDETILTINPLQFCAQYCKFCYKGIKDLLPDYRKRLRNYSAQEVLKRIQEKYENLKYEDISEITVMTGRFQSYNQMKRFLSELYAGIVSISDGRFDPCRNNWQRIKISTHLIDSKDKMYELKKYGISRYIYPIETVCDDTRKALMSSKSFTAGTNKGDVPFSEIIECLRLAREVYGEDNVEATIVLGLDQKDDLIEGLNRIYETDARILTYSFFRAYSLEQLSLYKMTLEEMLDIEDWIRTHFKRGYREKSNNQMQDYADKYKNIRDY